MKGRLNENNGASNLLIGAAAQQAQKQEAYQMQELFFLRNLHSDVVKQVYLTLVQTDVMSAGNPAHLDKLASAAKLAGDRLMISMGFMKEPEASA